MMKQVFLLFALLSCQILSAQVPKKIIYAVSSDCKLMYFNVDPCGYSIIDDISLGCTGDVQLTDITFIPNNRLYGINRYNIVEIDTATAEATPICSYTDPVFILSSSLVHLNDSILITDGSDSLFAINLNDCSVTSLGYTGTEFDGDLTWYKSDLYGISASILYKITFNVDHTAITSVTPVNGLSNPMPTAWGLVTLGDQKDDGKIVMFGDAPWILSVNPETLEMDTVGIPMPPKGVWGATSCIRYVDTVVDIDTTTDIDTSVTSLNNLENDLELVVYPNPVIGSKIHIKLGSILIQKINLFDYIGRRIEILYGSPNRDMVISLPQNLASGIYILEFISDKHYIKKKVFVK